VTENRADALARLNVFIGDWAMETRFPGQQPVPLGAAGSGPTAHSRFEWDLSGQFLIQHTEIPIPEAPDSLAIVATDPQTGGYTQHYYDSRGVVRLYAMDFAGGVWTLTRESPDFSPLDFRQRFTGTFSEDENTITGAWEKCAVGGEWEHDFASIHRRCLVIIFRRWPRRRGCARVIHRFSDVAFWPLTVSAACPDGAAGVGRRVAVAVVVLT
jgi:hypothetical protein